MMVIHSSARVWGSAANHVALFLRTGFWRSIFQTSEKSPRSEFCEIWGSAKLIDH